MLLHLIKRELLIPLLSIGGTPLQRLHTTKFLGMHTDERLSWKNQIEIYAPKVRVVILCRISTARIHKHIAVLQPDILSFIVWYNFMVTHA